MVLDLELIPGDEAFVTIPGVGSEEAAIRVCRWRGGFRFSVVLGGWGQPELLGYYTEKALEATARIFNLRSYDLSWGYLIPVAS